MWTVTPRAIENSSNFIQKIDIRNSALLVIVTHNRVIETIFALSGIALCTMNAFIYSP
jgi:hypothetical protein